MAVYQCPSSESQKMANSDGPGGEWKGSYGLNWGQYSYLQQRFKAPFFLEYGAKFSDIQDGTSKTLAMMEIIQAPSGGARQVELNAGVDARGVDFLNSQVAVAGEVVTPPIAPASAARQATGELPQTGINQVPFILASGILLLAGLLLLALGIIRSHSS